MKYVIETVYGQDEFHFEDVDDFWISERGHLRIDQDGHPDGGWEFFPSEWLYFYIIDER